ncbi:MAG: M14 family zinc carboxypeptidase [bacterium]
MAGLLVLALADPASAVVVPGFNPRIEDVIVGPRVRPGAVRTEGTWFTLPGRVAPGPGGTIWMVETQGQAITDGTLRARFAGVENVEVTLVLRAVLSEDGKRVVDAYGLYLRGRDVALVRIENGRHEVVKRARLNRHRADGVELVAQIFDRHLILNVYDGDKGALLGSLSTSDLPRRPGAIGLIAGDRWLSDSPMTLLSTRPLCQDVPNDAHRGPPHVVRIAEVGGVKPKDWGDPLERFPGQPPTVAVRTGPVGVERLFCDGPELLDVTNDLPWKFVDTTYRLARGRDPVKAGRGFDLTKSYKNVDMVNALLEGWHRRYPRQTLLQRIGTTRQGRPIMALGIADGIEPNDTRPSMLLNASHHANEPVSTEFVLDAIQQLLEQRKPSRSIGRILRGMVVWCVPVVNPDGNWGFFELSKGLGRKNARDLDGDGRFTDRDGVDLNRNYPFKWGALGEKGSQSDPLSRYYRGDRPASEPETQAMMGLANRERFAASISFHTGTVAVLAPYTIDDTLNPEPNEAWTVAEEVVKDLPRHPQNRPFRVVRQLYSVDGTDQDWLRHEHGTLALLVEGAQYTPRDLSAVPPIVESVRPIWVRLLERYVEGPAVSGTVTDSDGRPVYAEVRTGHANLREGERWMTRCRDGRFDRYLGTPGPYTVEIRARGYPPIVMSGYARKGKREHLKVRLPGPAVPSADCPVQ